MLHCNKLWVVVLHCSNGGSYFPSPLTETPARTHSAEMTRLWNLHPNNLEACKISERDFVPALETYFTPAIEQLSPKADLKEEKK